MNEPHSAAIQQGTYVLLTAFSPDRYTLRFQLPMRLGESRPLPDFVILGSPPKQNLRIPVTAMLVIEVSDTTLEFDQVEKAELYAKHGLPEYWILDVNARCLEVRRRPEGIGQDGAKYGELTMYVANQAIAPLSAAESLVAIADLLP